MYMTYGQVVTKYMNKKYILQKNKQPNFNFFFEMYPMSYYSSNVFSHYFINTMLIKTIKVCSVSQCNNITI